LFKQVIAKSKETKGKISQEIGKESLGRVHGR
jgi:hypothetical protein